MSGPLRDEAPAGGAARGFREHHSADTPHCADPDQARKRVATAQARAALIGLELAELHDGAWSLSYAAFRSAGHVCTVPSLQAAEAALYAFEQELAEMRALLQGVR